jgi:hypothetical protein
MRVEISKMNDKVSFFAENFLKDCKKDTIIKLSYSFVK